MLKTGEEHLESLRDGRRVYIGGEEKDVVVAHDADPRLSTLDLRLLNLESRISNLESYRTINERTLTIGEEKVKIEGCLCLLELGAGIWDL